jgi:hypothetical protein
MSIQLASLIKYPFLKCQTMIKTEIVIEASDFWVKIVEFLQQNWALIEKKQDKVIVWFIHDRSGVFDKIEFRNEQEATDGLIRNGFHRYLDPSRKYTEFIRTPKPPFYKDPRIIYSNGEYWI